MISCSTVHTVYLFQASGLTVGSIASGDVEQILKTESVLRVAGGRYVLFFGLKLSIGFPPYLDFPPTLPATKSNVTVCFRPETDAVTERCDSLRLLADQPQCTPADRENIAAVIHDYEQGISIPQPGNAVLYFSGKKMTEEIPLGGVSLKDKIDGQGGHIMVESGQETKYRCATTTTYPSIGPNWHNMVRQRSLFPYRQHITDS